MKLRLFSKTKKPLAELIPKHSLKMSERFLKNLDVSG